MGSKKSQSFRAITLGRVHNFIPQTRPICTPMVRFANGIVKIGKIRKEKVGRRTNLLSVRSPGEPSRYFFQIGDRVPSEGNTKPT